MIALTASNAAEDGSTTRSRFGAAVATAAAAGSTAASTAQPSRNRPCSCGSGRKYKHSPTAARP
jgi:preprotein translocase subunit SecA